MDKKSAPQIPDFLEKSGISPSRIIMFGIPWYRLPTPLALFQLLQLRNKLREKNLQDTSQLPNKDELPKPVPSPDGQHLRVRTADGSFNDLDRPEMGMAGTR